MQSRRSLLGTKNLIINEDDMYQRIVLYTLVLFSSAFSYAQLNVDQNHKDLYRVVVFGDSGRGNKIQYDVANAMLEICRIKQGCDFAIGLGDNIYNSGVSSIHDRKFQTHFERPFEIFGRFDFWMILGNHDWRKSAQAQIDYTQISERWRMPNYHYKIPDLPEWLTIFGFDTTKLNTTQLADGRRALCGINKIKVGWRVAFGHHPFFSNGKHGNNSDVENYLSNTFEACDVQVYMAGHDHHQEHLQHDSRDYFIQGAVAEVRKVKKGKEKDKAQQKYASAEYGFAIFEFTKETLNVEFYNEKKQKLYGYSRILEIIEN